MSENCIKVTRTDTATTDTTSWYRTLVNGSYKKAKNEFGEITLLLEYYKTDEDLRVDDFIEVFIGTNRLCTGYVIKSKVRSDGNVDITAFTEEVKMLKMLTPDSYEPNVTGLSVENLADFCRREYGQERYSDKSKFDEVIKEITDSSDVVDDTFFYGDAITKSTSLEVRSGDYYFYLQLSSDDLKEGIYQTYSGSGYQASYDRVLTMTLHENYTNGTYSLNTDDTAKVSDLGAFMFCDTLSSGTLVLRTFDDTGTEISHVSIGGEPSAFFSDSNSGIVGMKVIGGRGKYLKVYIDSSKSLASEELISLLSNNFFDAGTTPDKICVRLEQATEVPYTNFYTTPYYVKGYISASLLPTPSTTKPLIIERIRWSEKYRTWDTEKEEWIQPKKKKWYEFYKLNKGAKLRKYDLGGENHCKFYMDLITAGTYDSSNLPAASTVADDNNGFKFADFTEYTEMSGYLANEEITSAKDLYFAFQVRETTVSSDAFNSKRFEVLDTMLYSEILKAFEIVYYQNALDVDVATTIKDKVTTIEEADNTSMYDILKTVCDELDLVFYVLDNTIYITEITEASTDSYELAEDINCTVSEFLVDEEEYYNKYKIFGEGDSIIDRPLINYNVTSLDGNTNPSSMFKQNAIILEDEFSAIIDSEKADTVERSNPNSSIKVTCNIDSDDINVINVGDSIDLLLDRNDKRYDLYVIDVNYTFDDSDFNAKISSGDIKKLL